MEIVEAALAKATELKAKGAALFAAGQHSDALDQYLAAVAAVSPAAPSPAPEDGGEAVDTGGRGRSELYGWPQLEEATVACRSNAALCYLKLGRAADALAESDAGLELAAASSLVSTLLLFFFTPVTG